MIDHLHYFIIHANKMTMQMLVLTFDILIRRQYSTYQFNLIALVGYLYMDNRVKAFSYSSSQNEIGNAMSAKTNNIY